MSGLAGGAVRAFGFHYRIAHALCNLCGWVPETLVPVNGLFFVRDVAHRVRGWVEQIALDRLAEGSEAEDVHALTDSGVDVTLSEVAREVECIVKALHAHNFARGAASEELNPWTIIVDDRRGSGNCRAGTIDRVCSEVFVEMTTNRFGEYVVGVGSRVRGVVHGCVEASVVWPKVSKQRAHAVDGVKKVSD